MTIYADLRKKLDGKKSSLKKTYRSNKETNDKVYNINEKMSGHLENPRLIEK